MKCGFCGYDKEDRGPRRCPEHGDLRMPWESLPPRRGPRRLHPPAQAAPVPVGRMEADGLVVMFAWCEECRSSVTPRGSGRCGTCGGDVLDGIRVPDVRLLSVFD